MSDPDGAADPVPPAVPILTETNRHEYEFVDSDWIAPPFPKDIDWFGREERTIRDAHAYAYQQFGTTYHWSRYIHLGYFAYINCTAFDKIWSKMNQDPLTVHRAIWYNLMYHIERELPVSEKLNAWAFNVSQPYLEHYDTTFLHIDTAKYPNGIDSIKEGEKKKEKEDEHEWKTVPEKKRSNSPTNPTQEPTNRKRGGILRVPTAPGKSTKNNLPKNKPTSTSTPEQPNASTKTQAASKAPDNTDEPMEIDDVGPAKQPPGILIADLPPRLPTQDNASYPKIPTNDGTHRITVKWTPPTDVEEFANDEQRLNEALFTLMQTLFQDDDGVFYCWDSEETSTTKAASSLTEANAREFVSPKITFMESRTLIVFGLRFGFLAGPAKWQHNERTKQALKEQKIDILISNSKSTSGNIVTAGYILLKAPNSTHRHFYTQFLRSQMPDATPYFDIVRYKHTPMDQLIPHLAVQCGDKHVTPLCQALLTVLTGKGSALFIPRYAFNTMSPDQVKRHFEVHKNWSRSLKAITLTPKITHLDRQRVEYFDDGTIIKRSTREWILSLNHKNGKPSYCDAVNGGSNRQTTLVCPQTFLEQAQDEWRQYKSRLNPPSHRESRFFDSIAGLPPLNHIRTEIKSSVSLLNHLSTADIWSQAPPEIREPPPARGRSKQRASKNNQRTRSTSTQARNVSTTPSARSDTSCSESETTQGDTIPANDFDAQSIASTAASTNAPPTHTSSRIQELERMIKSAQKQSDIEGKASAAKLSNLQSQFTEMDGKMTALQTNQERLSTELTTMRDQSTQQYNDIRSNIVTSMEATNEMSQSMVDIRQQFSQMSTFMMDLARTMERVLETRNGVPPEVNVTRPMNRNYPGSDSSSVIGDPSQATFSEVSKTISLLSSTGKRSIAAVQVPAPYPAETSVIHRRSPIKKKQRARIVTDPNATDSSDTDDMEKADSAPRLNLETQFRSVDESSQQSHDDELSIDPMAPVSQDTLRPANSDGDGTQPPFASVASTEQTNSAINSPDNSGAENENDQVNQLDLNHRHAPPNQQYTEANGLAGANPG